MAKMAPREPDDASAGKPYEMPKPGSGIVVTKKNAPPPPPPPDPKDKDIWTADKGIPPPFEPDDASAVQKKPTKKASGGMTASQRADGIAQRGKTRGTMVACGGGYMKGK